MDFNLLAEEIAEVLETITGFRVWSHPPGSISPPAAVVSYPNEIEYDQTYQRGMAEVPNWTIWIVDGKPTEKATRERILTYASTSGPKSVKDVLEAHEWVNCDEVTLPSAEFDVVTIGAIDYMAVGFPLKIVGSGK